MDAPAKAAARVHRAFRNDGSVPLICPTCQDVLADAGGGPATMHGVVFDIFEMRPSKACSPLPAVCAGKLPVKRE
jgi:hypothetical protein